MTPPKQTGDIWIIWTWTYQKRTFRWQIFIFNFSIFNTLRVKKKRTLVSGSPISLASWCLLRDSTNQVTKALELKSSSTCATHEPFSICHKTVISALAVPLVSGRIWSNHGEYSFSGWVNGFLCLVTIGNRKWDFLLTSHPNFKLTEVWSFQSWYPKRFHTTWCGPEATHVNDLGQQTMFWHVLSLRFKKLLY